MSTYTKIYYHFVFATKHREPVLDEDRRDDLFRYIWGLLKNRKCQLIRINGMYDHVHVFLHIHPTVKLADIVKEIKTSSVAWISKIKIFPHFTNWQEGYGAFTHSYQESDTIIEYIKNQQEHHKVISFLDEYRNLLKKSGLTFNEKYMP